MIGFVTTQEQATAANAAIAEAQTSRGLPVFWSPGSYPIHSGEHAGKYFIPAGDGILDAPLMGNPIQTPVDFPEFTTIVGAMGGLESRVEIDPFDIASPEEP